ncbi:DC1 - like 10 [Theobroma cacao]|nr:DC1 - like 10 [Theobroma cacao]
MKSEGEKLIQHFTHWHPLKLIQNKEEDQVCCFICQKVCSGSATAYGCEKCQFFLHDSCMISIPRKINHFFHPCPLILCTSGIFYTCGGCEDSGAFLTFSCRRCRFELDVKCAVLPTVKSGGAEQIQHPSHQHPLTLLENIKGRGVRCKACGKICSGLTNTFGCRRCKPTTSAFAVWYVGLASISTAIPQYQQQ